MRRVVELPYGARTLSAEAPGRNLVGVYAPQPVPVCTDPEGEIARALAAPLGTPPLRALVRRGETVVVLLDDHTRATPAARILPLVLEELLRGGVREEDITLLITHGTHRLSTEAEVRAKVGDEIARRFRVEQHQCTDRSRQVYIGLTSRGTPVWVHRVVAEADRRVGIGHIGPSPYAGYSGGYKLILPGAAALETINVNHSLVPLGFRQPGRVEVPCRLDIDEAGRMVGLDFVVDVVFSQDERIVRAFAGTPEAVFREGVALARTVYEVAVPPDLDIAVTAGYPYDLDLYQAVRAVEYADATVRTGGSILLVAACPEGIGGDDFYRLMADPARRPDDFLRDVARRNGMVTFAVLGYALARIKAEKRLYMVTDGIPPALLEAMGITPVPSLQAGIDALLQRYGPEARLAVFPMGSSTIPCRPQGSGKVPC
ncbi:MAG: nickel-dependent lactate racemase [Anaerolineae bacterium]